MHLFRRDPAAQDSGPYIAEARLLLRMNANVIAVDVCRRILGFSRIESKPDPPFEFLLKVMRRPAVSQEKKFQPGPLAVLAQLVRVTEQLGNSPDHRQNLVPAHERIQRRTQVGLGRKPPAHAQGETNLRLSFNDTLSRSEANIVNLRIGAPDAASRDGNLELARQVVELGIPCQHLVGFERERRSIAYLVRVHACDGAAGYVSRDIPAGAHCVQTDTPEFFHHLRQSFDGDPVQLNVLPNREIGDAACVAAGKAGDDSQLVRSQQTVRDANPQHEEWQGESLAIFAANNSNPVALGVDSPPAE